MAEQEQNIRIVKRGSNHGGHHGGAWKVAYADFVTAMMAFFLVMWIVSLNQAVKDAIAGYFKDPVKFMAQVKAGNAPFTITSLEGTAKKGSPGKEFDANERAKLELTKRVIQKIVAATPELKDIRKYVDIKLGAEGLRIELLEVKESLFFDSGSAKIKPRTAHLLALITRELRKLPNKVVIEGHTDSRPLNRNDGYTNWELSADRANSARRVMVAAGLRKDQLVQVRGYADTQPRVPGDPKHFANRRVTIVVVLSEAFRRKQIELLEKN
ncbi:MAG: OmpA family protein [Armatimonadota bacterium]|nr:OmpA family protein [Armatimonadota bacterium]